MSFGESETIFRLRLKIIIEKVASGTGSAQDPISRLYYSAPAQAIPSRESLDPIQEIQNQIWIESLTVG